MASEARVSIASAQRGTPAAGLGDFSVDEVESLVCVEWLGARSYSRPHSRRLVRALIAYALAPDSPVRDYIVERYVHLELLMQGTYGMSRPAILNEFSTLARAVRSVVAEIGAWPKLADRIDARLQESLAPLGRWDTGAAPAA